LMSDEQSRRNRMLAAVLGSSEPSHDSERPVLYFWTRPWPLGLQFDPSAQRAGVALIAAPLALERPPAGAEMLIPSPLLPFREVTGPDGVHPSGMYDHRREEWQEKSAPTSNWLRFQVPLELLPLAPT